MRKVTLYFIIAMVLIIIIAICLFIVRRLNSKDLGLTENMTVTSNAFVDGGSIPVKYTGVGEDISPDLHLSEISPEAVSIALLMDDLDFPMGTYNHWVVWNLPVMKDIPEAIPAGPVIETLQNAVQGKGYGVNRYKGPNPPFGTHRYKYQVYVLDIKMDLNSNAGKKELLEQMKGHVLQYGSITGNFKKQ